MNKRNVITTILVLLVLVAGGIATGVLVQQSKSDAAIEASSNVETSIVTQDALSGFWKSDDPKMKATVTQSTVEIIWEDGDMSGLYWKGTFLVPARLINGSKIMSEGDTDVMSESLLASRDTSKEFTFEKNTLAFKLTTMGVTKTVRLVRT